VEAVDVVAVVATELGAEPAMEDGGHRHHADTEEVERARIVAVVEPRRQMPTATIITEVVVVAATLDEDREGKGVEVVEEDNTMTEVLRLDLQCETR
jgi:hypothetical protein